MSKIIDTITFFNENFIFDLRYKILKNFVDYFLVCEAEYDHRGNYKKLNFDYKKYFNDEKIKYFVYKKPLNNENPWANQAIQREFILENLTFADDDDYILFSDPDEIPNSKVLKNFNLEKKYAIFFQKSFNYKFNLFNKYETPWEGTRATKKKNLKSIDFLRQKVVSKNLKYNFLRFDKEKSIQVINNGGWHFNNIMTPEQISIKLKTFAHKEYSSEEFSSPDIIKKKTEKKIDLFNRDYKYYKVELDKTFPEYLLNNQNLYKKFII